MSKFKEPGYYRTRSGHKAYVMGNLPLEAQDSTHKHCLLGTINGVPYSWLWDGSTNVCQQNTFDLVDKWREPIKIERWAVVNRESGSILDLYPNESEARIACGRSGAVGCVVIKLTGVEGKG
jgi:hypothetical protein